MKKRVAIIGGGAAGLMAAATLLESGGFEVDLFERNKGLGAKVIISGGGRCNVTTGITQRKELLSKYTRGAEFLKFALGKFSPKKVMEWFEGHGVKLKIENDLRVFPVSDDGKDVVGVFEKIFRDGGLNVRLVEAVRNIEPVDQKMVRVVSDKGEYEFDFVILTTGGNAYRHTGSQGDGYAFAKNFGHSVTKLGPSLNSFLTNEDWPKKLSGLSLGNVRLEAKAEDGEIKKITGPLLFTHFGISGPAVFALSSHLAFTKISVHHPLEIKVVPEAEMGREKWDQEIQSYFDANGSQQVLTLMKKYFPQRLAETFIELAGLTATKKNAEISKSERMELVKLLAEGFPVTTVQRRPGDEFVTAGGVVLGEVDSKTMRSKLHSSLFFGGEILDVDGVTGGFNLQASWATGRLAGKSVAIVDSFSV